MQGCLNWISSKCAITTCFFLKLSNDNFQLFIFLHFEKEQYYFIRYIMENSLNSKLRVMNPNSLLTIPTISLHQTLNLLPDEFRAIFSSSPAFIVFSLICDTFFKELFKTLPKSLYSNTFTNIQ